MSESYDAEGGTISYVYDNVGREQKRSYKYDALGRVIEIKDEAGTISYTYDANGNVLTVKDKQGTMDVVS